MSWQSRARRTPLPLTFPDKPTHAVQAEPWRVTYSILHGQLAADPGSGQLAVHR